MIYDPSEINPSRLSAKQAAWIFSKCGAGDFSEMQVQAAIDAGCPVNEDNTLNVVHLAAWLNQEVQRHAN